MSIKTILVPFGGQDTEIGTLQTALSLAKLYNAHVEVWHVSPNPYKEVTLYSGPSMAIPYFDEETIKALKEFYVENRKEAKSKYFKIIRENKIPHLDNPGNVMTPSVSFHWANGDVEHIISTRARLTDLIVLCRSPKRGGSRFPDVIDSCLFKTGKPVLLIPPGKSARRLNGKAVIGWNASIESSRAVNASLPLLQKGKALIVTAMTNEAKNFPIPAKDLAEHLERHEIATKVLQVDTGKTSPSEILLKAVKNMDAGLLVIGAYTHSRLREVILGGVTDHMLRKANIPVLMMH